MIGRAGLSTKCWRVLRWVGLAAAAPALWACTSRTLETPTITPTQTVTSNFQQKINNEIDILFMVDNSSSMTEMQSKLYDQLPLFMQVLEMLPNGLPSVHIAVVSSDMGAPGDSTSSIMCTPAGDQGQFQSVPRGTCTATNLTAGDTFISADSGNNNYTGDIATVFQCIALLGDKGCGFEHQLASIDRALGADGAGPPGTNANFLRPEAYLGIIILTNEDDCSAPSNTQLYSLNGGQQNISNPLGPIANYRCNEFGHLCNDPSGNQIEPPLRPPGNAMGTAAAPTLDMTGCISNDTGNGLLTSVSQFVSDIKALKGVTADSQILVAAITAPAAPYTVEWLPASGGQGTQPGELWPAIMHSCGAKGAADVNPSATMNPTDGSFGDPGVRISQFVNSFPNSVLASICDASYAPSMQLIAQKLGQLITPPCVSGTIQLDSMGQAMCSVIETKTDMQGTTTNKGLQNCMENGGAQPCWNLMQNTTNCPNSAQISVTDDTAATAQSAASTINCSICIPNVKVVGCPCPGNTGTIDTGTNCP